MATPKVELRMSAELRERIDAEAERAGVTRTAWIVNACWKVLAGEAALRGDTQNRTRANASATGAVTARGASRPAAPPRRFTEACPVCHAIGGSHFRGCSKA